ncbi:MAG TPA: ABC transporter ATP-binding protein [Saprospiraceae bacterium]|nr:ABC transporter ATP-binding protein [Saprospiraceae bacterium]
MEKLLEINQLRIAFEGREETVRALTMYIDRGEIVGIAGPSGSGKSLTVWSLLGLIPEKCHMSGSFKYYNATGTLTDILSLSDARAWSGQTISIVPQNPFTSLNPVFRCGPQIAEMLKNQTGTKAQRKARVLRHLKDLGFEHPERIYTAYPFELSGGQLQRVVIAMATIADPDLIIADEPTTALDVVTQAEVLDLLLKWVKSGNKSMFLVSHDILLLRRYCDRIYFMHEGQVVRSGAAHDMLHWMHQASDSYLDSPEDAPVNNSILCETSGLSIRYYSRSGELVEAVHDLDFNIKEGEAVGLVGSTGCGKTTVAKSLTGLVRHHKGTLTFQNKPLDFGRFPELRRHIQMIFQDPYSALYPHLTVGSYLREAIRHHRITGKINEEAMISESLEKVGLAKEFAWRYAHQLSGGERQRVQIARAILLTPKLLICDEITSGLDAAIQGQILQLLRNLRTDTGMALLIISHDLNVIRYMTDRVLVMDKGMLVEEGTVNAIFTQPKHEITRVLMEAQSVTSARGTAG